MYLLAGAGWSACCETQHRFDMTDDQTRIAEWLRQQVPTLLPAFEKAAELMANSDFPGRANFVCHACRDICTIIQQYYRVDKTEKANTTTLLDTLDGLWSQYRINEVTHPIASVSGSPDPSNLAGDIAISREILQAVQSVLEEHRRGAVNQKNQALNMFQNVAPEAVGRPDLFDVHAEQWRNLREWFHEHAHFTLKKQECDPLELKGRVTLLETHLLTMVSTFYEGVAELDKIMGQNPTPDTIDRAIALMSHPEQQRYFFERLDQPTWLAALEEKGMFQQLPVQTTDPDRGITSYYDWPAGRYLARMAVAEPTRVAKVRPMLESAAALPAEDSKALVPKIALTLNSPSWFSADLAGALALKLASGGQDRAALRILKALFNVAPRPQLQHDSGRTTQRSDEALPLLGAFDFSRILVRYGESYAHSLGLPYRARQ
jgi:hypothetical protein